MDNLPPIVVSVCSYEGTSIKVIDNGAILFPVGFCHGQYVVENVRFGIVFSCDNLFDLKEELCNRIVMKWNCLTKTDESKLSKEEKKLKRGFLSTFEETK